jgi:NAD(P)-dependent dehydrogenase (short-subunit alcohol dehydrogenase family)
VLEDQVAVVTGGGRGIGKAIAHRFAAEGARVGVLDVEAASAVDTAEEIGRGAFALTVDVSDPDAVAGAFGGLDRLDVLVNNAGVETRAPFLEITPDEWRRSRRAPPWWRSTAVGVR